MLGGWDASGAQGAAEQIEAQADSLRRQARQATRYKGLAGEIRRHEALLYHIAYRDATREILGGIGIHVTDEQYRDAGAAIAEDAAQIWERAELIVKVKEPIEAEYDLLHEGQILFTYLHLAPAPQLTEVLLRKKVIGIAYETVTDARGALPLLVPMSEIAGRLAPQIGAHFLEKQAGGRGVLLAGAERGDIRSRTGTDVGGIERVIR